MNYITRPSQDLYEVFDKTTETTFMDGLTVEQAEHLAYKLNGTISPEQISDSESFNTLDEHFTAVTKDTHYNKQIMNVDVGWIKNECDEFIETMKAGTADQIDDHIQYEMEYLNDKQKDELNHAVKTALDTHMEKVVNEIELIIIDAERGGVSEAIEDLYHELNNMIGKV